MCQAAVAISENAIVFVGIDMDGETIVFSANIADNQMKVNVLDGLTVISARYAPTTAETLFLITENKQILTGVIDASTGQVKNLNLATGINTDVLNRNVRGFIPGDNGNLLLHTTDIVEIGDREAPTFSLIEIPATNFAAA